MDSPPLAMAGNPVGTTTSGGSPMITNGEGLWGMFDGAPLPSLGELPVLGFADNVSDTAVAAIDAAERQRQPQRQQQEEEEERQQEEEDQMRTFIDDSPLRTSGEGDFQQPEQPQLPPPPPQQQQLQQQPTVTEVVPPSNESPDQVVHSGTSGEPTPQSASESHSPTQQQQQQQSGPKQLPQQQGHHQQQQTGAVSSLPTTGGEPLLPPITEPGSGRCKVCEQRLEEMKDSESLQCKEAAVRFQANWANSAGLGKCGLTCFGVCKENEFCSAHGYPLSVCLANHKEGTRHTPIRYRGSWVQTRKKKSGVVFSGAGSGSQSSSSAAAAATGTTTATAMEQVATLQMLQESGVAPPSYKRLKMEDEELPELNRTDSCEFSDVVTTTNGASAPSMSTAAAATAVITTAPPPPAMKQEPSSPTEVPVLISTVPAPCSPSGECLKRIRKLLLLDWVVEAPTALERLRAYEAACVQGCCQGFCHTNYCCRIHWCPAEIRKEDGGNLSRYKCRWPHEGVNRKGRHHADFAYYCGDPKCCKGKWFSRDETHKRSKGIQAERLLQNRGENAENTREEEASAASSSSSSSPSPQEPIEAKLASSDPTEDKSKRASRELLLTKSALEAEKEEEEEINLPNNSNEAKPVSVVRIHQDSSEKEQTVPTIGAAPPALAAHPHPHKLPLGLMIVLVCLYLVFTFVHQCCFIKSSKDKNLWETIIAEGIGKSVSGFVFLFAVWLRRQILAIHERPRPHISFITAEEASCSLTAFPAVLSVFFGMMFTYAMVILGPSSPTYSFGYVNVLVATIISYWFFHQRQVSFWRWVPLGIALIGFLICLFPLTLSRSQDTTTRPPFHAMVSLFVAHVALAMKLLLEEHIINRQHIRVWSLLLMEGVYQILAVLLIYLLSTVVDLSNPVDSTLPQPTLDYRKLDFVPFGWWVPLITGTIAPAIGLLFLYWSTTVHQLLLFNALTVFVSLAIFGWLPFSSIQPVVGATVLLVSAGIYGFIERRL